MRFGATIRFKADAGASFIRTLTHKGALDDKQGVDQRKRSLIAVVAQVVIRIKIKLEFWKDKFFKVTKNQLHWKDQ